MYFSAFRPGAFRLVRSRDPMTKASRKLEFLTSVTSLVFGSAPRYAKQSNATRQSTVECEDPASQHQCETPCETEGLMSALSISTTCGSKTFTPYNYDNGTAWFEYSWRHMERLVLSDGFTSGAPHTNEVHPRPVNELLQLFLKQLSRTMHLSPVVICVQLLKPLGESILRVGAPVSNLEGI